MLLGSNYGGTKGNHRRADLQYSVGRQLGTSFYSIVRNGSRRLKAADDGEFLFLFEEDITIQLQKLRADLYFLHSAGLGFAGKAVMLVGPSGSGKSTTAWALLHHGFRYLSDELGPVNLKTMEVYPYPHALCLKKEPPRCYPLPEKTFCTSRTLHVPIKELPSGVNTSPTPLAAVFFLRCRAWKSKPSVRPLSKAEAGTRLFVNALNPLAHPGEGLDGALQIASQIPCFELTTASLPATCALVKDTLRDLFEANSRQYAVGSE